MIYGSSLAAQVMAQLRGHGISLSLNKSGSLIIYKRAAFTADQVEKVIDAPSLDAFYVYPHSFHLTRGLNALAT